VRLGASSKRDPSYRPVPEGEVAPEVSIEPIVLLATCDLTQYDILVEFRTRGPKVADFGLAMYHRSAVMPKRRCSVEQASGVNGRWPILSKFPYPRPASMRLDYRSFFQNAMGFAPFPYQVRLGEAGLPDRLVVPTGFGKTEAAVLAWVWRRLACPDLSIRANTPSRLIYCLPMRVLVEQTVARLRAALERLRASGSLVAVPEVHALLGGAVEPEWEGQPDKAVILVGTQDQLLSRALNRGYGMSRYLWPVHFALLNNDCQWVLDEVQLMGVGLSTTVQLQAFRESLGAFGAAKSMWMSATLDAGRLDTVDARDRKWSEAGIADDDLAHPTLASRWNATKLVKQARAAATDTKAGAQEVVDAHIPGTLTLVVVNRVRRAQDLYSALAKLRLAVPVRLLHARFRPAERAAIQDEILATGWSGILVSTQAVEAGVDISARTLFTDLAPWPSMVQRLGRLNRRGEWGNGEASVRWFDLPDDEDAALPYELDDVREARARIKSCSDAGPASLAQMSIGTTSPILPVLRRRDLMQLFDTEPDLAGHDIDVSPYIRGSRDTDVQVAWREWEGDSPGADSPEIHRNELCSVSVSALLALLKGQPRPWRWNGTLGKWERVTRIVPGMVLLVPITLGGYDRSLGWTGDPKQRPAPIELAGRPPDSDDTESYTFGCSRFVALREHAEDAAAEMSRLRQCVHFPNVPWEALIKSARWHDLGKAHEVFQAMLMQQLAPSDPKRSQGPWAKSDGRGARARRPHFRHELASALALLAQGGSDLECYLVAAHHGKVRMSLRARPGELEPPDGRLFALGIWANDVLPSVDLGAGVVVSSCTLSLDCMQLGGGAAVRSWLERTSGLLSSEGPFRLSFLESLVRIADWRATARYQGAVAREVQHG
jgi:CRISPR-associated endonuclease/helicase Cas3